VQESLPTAPSGLPLLLQVAYRLIILRPVHKEGPLPDFRMECHTDGSSALRKNEGNSERIQWLDEHLEGKGVALVESMMLNQQT